jgi:uncharacterized membrane protein YhhN
MEFGPVFWALIAVSAAAPIAYGLFFLNRPPSLVRAGVKTAFMAALAAAFEIAGARGILVLAFAAAALGDFFLAFDKKWTLGLGIITFLASQLLYLTIFFALWMFAGDNAPFWPRYAALALIAFTTLAFLIWLAPKLGWLALGVVPYSLAIGAMAAMAWWIPWAGWPAMLGVMLFLISDGVLSAELFRLAPDAPARRMTAPLVWWSYAAAQALIAFGIIAAARATV